MKKKLFLFILCCLTVLSYGQNNGINGYMHGAKNMLKGDVIEFSVPADKNYHNVVWTIDGNYFSVQERGSSSFDNWVKLKAIKATPAVKLKVKVSAKNGNFEPIDNFTDEMDVKINDIPEFTIVPVNGNVECLNNEITYRLDGVIPTGSQIYWNKYTNMTFVREQGTNSAVFKATGNGVATLEVVIWHSEKQYKQVNSAVWIGIPETPSGVSGFSNGKNFNLNSLYSLSAYEANGATEYIWSITDGGEIRKYDVNGNRNVEMYTSINVGWNQTKSFSLRVSARNKCGTSSERALTGYVTYASGGIDEFSLRSATIELEPEIKSVKVYNLSGVLVYSDNAVNGSFDIKSTVLIDGIYIIEKFDGENRTSEKVILKR